MPILSSDDQAVAFMFIGEMCFNYGNTGKRYPLCGVFFGRHLVSSKARVWVISVRVEKCCLQESEANQRTALASTLRNLSLGIVCRVYTKGPGYLGRDAFSSCMPTIWLWSTIERSTFTDFPPGRIAHNRSLLLHVFVCFFICKIKERYHTRAVPDDTMFPAHGNWQASLLFEVSSLDLLAK